MYYPDELIEEVRTRNDIVDVISDYVRLQKKGSSYFGLCPFHNEKSPSFSVSRQKQMYYCFGCGAHGDIFDFVSQMEDITFREAFFNLGGTYEQKKETFGERMSRYHARKEWEMQQRQKENLEERRKVNSELIDIYRDCLILSAPLSDLWTESYNKLQYQLYLHEILNEPR